MVQEEQRIAESIAEGGARYRTWEEGRKRGEGRWNLDSARAGSCD